MDAKQQPTGYNFEVNGKLVKDHECPICLHIIRNATELPCSHLMCRDCLIYYEDNNLEKNENSKFNCSICKEVYKRDQKKEVRSTDRLIRQSLEVKCKNWKYGCDWFGSISDFEDHHTNVCNFHPVECPNDGCNQQLRRGEIKGHQETCPYLPVPCNYCEEMFRIGSLEDHHELCLLFPINCPNQDCKEVIQRQQMNDHCKNECQYQLVPCLYAEVGCTIQLPRREICSHQQEAMQQHSLLLLKSHVELSNKNRDLEKQLIKSNETIEQLQDIVTKQEKRIERQQSEIIGLLTDAKAPEESPLEQKLSNLETFAEHAANFLNMMKREKFFSSYSYLRQEDYDNHKDLKNYKSQLKELKGKELESDCCFLRKLRATVESSLNTLFPSMYDARLTKCASHLEKDVLWYHSNDFMLLKTSMYPCRSISFNVFRKSPLFEEEMKRNEKWNRHSYFLATYYDYTECCYYVALFCKEDEGVRLMNKLNEKQNKPLKLNSKTEVTWHHYSISYYFMFQILK